MIVTYKNQRRVQLRPALSIAPTRQRHSILLPHSSNVDKSYNTGLYGGPFSCMQLCLAVSLVVIQLLFR